MRRSASKVVGGRRSHSANGGTNGSANGSAQGKWPLPTAEDLRARDAAEVESPRFRMQWQDRFPRAPLPKPGNIWLAFTWDSFKPMSGVGRRA